LRLLDQFREIEERLPDGWDAARLQLTVADEGNCDRAAALLGPTNPGRHGKVIRFFTARGGAGVGPFRVGALLKRLDQEGIKGDLKLVGSDVLEEGPAVQAPSLADAWDEARATLPQDWSDVYAEVELFSSDYVEPAALALSPLNPIRYGGRPALRFRVARNFGYGGSPEMVRRCLERLDERNIRGQLRILRALSDTKPAYTQGPVWYAGGKVF
jgi:hypothetical protein